MASRKFQRQDFNYVSKIFGITDQTRNRDLFNQLPVRQILVTGKKYTGKRTRLLLPTSGNLEKILVLRQDDTAQFCSTDQHVFVARPIQTIFLHTEHSDTAPAQGKNHRAGKVLVGEKRHCQEISPWLRSRWRKGEF